MIYLFRFRPTSMGSVYEKISRRKYGDNKVWMAGPHQVGNQELERKKNAWEHPYVKLLYGPQCTKCGLEEMPL